MAIMKSLLIPCFKMIVAAKVTLFLRGMHDHAANLDFICINWAAEEFLNNWLNVYLFLMDFVLQKCA